jgi:hypothetical protein
MQSIEDYAHDLIQRVVSDSEASVLSTHDAFAELVLQELETSGHVEEPMVAYYRSRGAEVSGYSYNEVRGSLDLFLIDFRETSKIQKIQKSELSAMSKRSLGYLNKVRHGLREEIPDAVEVADMAGAIQDLLRVGVGSIRVFLITNSGATTKALDDTIDDYGIPVTFEVWDLHRIHRLETSGALHEPISVEFNPPLQCLTTPRTDENYSVLLAIVPGIRLAELYQKYGSRLLELNVRSFLQLRGQVNKGMRETLLQNPERFLAYNNGISATGSEVELQPSNNGKTVLKRVKDLQIVNGGQTTASVHRAFAKDAADLEDVFVQMKLTVVNADHLDDIVPEISRFSNAQNKVTTVDFSSNHPFHVELEKSTRNLWAPALPGTGQETKWFFERARGQYDDALGREKTPARRKAFKAIHPTRQKFTKTDVAKWEHSWDQKPWLVARGAEKNFRAFMAELGQSAPTKDGEYVKRLLAKGILFRATERIVTAQKFGGYRANIVTYTIAKLSHTTAQRIDLDELWREQMPSEALQEALTQICREVTPLIMNPKGTTNIGEWTKREQLWAQVQELDWTPSSDLEQEFGSTASLGRRRAEDQVLTATSEELDGVSRVNALGSDYWFALSAWARETNNLQPWQRQLAFSLGKRIGREVEPTVKQARQGIKILEQAERLGYRGPS